MFWHGWLQTRLVRALKIELLEFNHVLDLVPPFYDAIANCATLEELSLKSVALPVPCFPHPLAVRTAAIAYCHVNLKAMFSGLTNVRTLHVSGHILKRSKQTANLHLILQLPHLVELKLNNVLHKSMEVLCKAICQSRVRDLDLGDYIVPKVSETFIESSEHCLGLIGTYLPQWTHLLKLNLRGFFIGTPSAETLGIGISRAQHLLYLGLRFKNRFDLSLLAPYLGQNTAQTLEMQRCTFHGLFDWFNNGHSFHQIFANDHLRSLVQELCIARQ
ncbi:Aste57867_7307 [Aphanomyces stellatus]|uniref:Aste57867_7307 protein n=1 Tax=Aphanomyces stellatus TaxID=120398 RepID=A0A485KI42_9STRA|nr:hypothetical protein As57867_007281 [Aphanomyces stellatus]VFT84226.1 Aste57867_7307 [Aphanomyces stellatus]